MTAPLTGVKVLDISTALAAPLTSQLLGDLGAEVIKVESPTGDGFRGRLYETTDGSTGGNPRFDCANRNKRSLSVDLRKPEGIEILLKLVEGADVLIVNFRPGVADRLGFGARRCQALNPRLIYASLTGFGEVGPWARRRGADIWAQSLGGTVAIQGSPGGEPMLGGTAFVDHGAPLALAFGIASALFQRTGTGEGAEVKTSLLETTLYMQSASCLTDYLNGEPLVAKGGRGWAAGFPMGAYPAADGDVVTMHVTNEQWAAFTEVLGLEELKDRPDLDTQEKRVARRDELYPILDAAFRKKSRAEWSKAFAATGVIRADAALRHDEVAAHPQVAALDSIIPVPHPSLGAFMAIAGPVTVGDTRSDVRRGPPSLGQHTREILTEVGVPEERIGKLFETAVVFDPHHPAGAAEMFEKREAYAVRLASVNEE